MYSSSDEDEGRSTVTTKDVQLLYVLLRHALAVAMERGGAAGAPAVLKEAYLMLRAVAGRHEDDDLWSLKKAYAAVVRDKQELTHVLSRAELTVGRALYEWQPLDTRAATLRAELRERLSCIQVVQALRQYPRGAALPEQIRLPRALWRMFERTWRNFPRDLEHLERTERVLDADVRTAVRRAEDWVLSGEAMTSAVEYQRTPILTRAGSGGTTDMPIEPASSAAAPGVLSIEPPPSGSSAAASTPRDAPPASSSQAEGAQGAAAAAGSAERCKTKGARPNVLAPGLEASSSGSAAGSHSGEPAPAPRDQPGSRSQLAPAAAAGPQPGRLERGSHSATVAEDMSQREHEPEAASSSPAASTRPVSSAELEAVYYAEATPGRTGFYACASIGQQAYDLVKSKLEELEEQGRLSNIDLDDPAELVAYLNHMGYQTIEVFPKA